MRMALRELRRRPKAFFVPIAILALLALLLLFPSSILDGIVLETTASVRTVPADLVSYAADANGIMLRSQIPPAVREQVAGVPGVAGVATFDVTVSVVVPEGKTDAVAVALQSSSEPLRTAVPAPGEAIADESLKDLAGFHEGMTVLLGAGRRPVKITGFSSGTNLWFANGLIVDRSTWFTTTAQLDAAKPAIPAEMANAAPTQALLVTVDPGAKPKDVAVAVDQATNGVTQSMTREIAVKSTPGIEQQEAIFAYMRGITLLVALVVVALFLSFMTLERAPLYAAMKAIGASSRQLFGAVVIQVVTITAIAITGAAVMTYSLTRLPSRMPTVMLPNRLIETTFALGITALLGACLSLRRVISVDAKDALG
jgi:putative ABC transport system permease protein